MKKPIREIPLVNGLTVRFYDSTRRYFGDYHQVRVTICCEVAVGRGFFDEEPSWQSALKLLGASVQYRKEIEHQGVAGQATADAIEKVIGDFVATSLPYFASDAFPKKLVHSELKRLSVKARQFKPLPANG